MITSLKRHVCSCSVDNNDAECDRKHNSHSSITGGGRSDVRASYDVIPDYSVSMHGGLAQDRKNDVLVTFPQQVKGYKRNTTNY